MQFVATTTENRPSTTTGFFDINNWWIFGAICLVYLFSSFYLQTQVLTDEVYYQSLSAQFSADEMDALLVQSRDSGIWGYILVPAMLLVKTGFTGLCLYTGLFFIGRSLSAAQIFKIALLAETAFVAATLVRLVWLGFFKEIDTFDSLRYFAPGSLFSLFDPTQVPNWLVFPLQTLNVFELGYVLLLAAGLQHFLQLRFNKMLLLSAASYGCGLLAWMLVVAFISMNLSA